MAMRRAAVALFVGLAVTASISVRPAAASQPQARLPAAITGAYIMLDGAGVAQVDTALKAGLSQLVVEGVGLMSGQVSVTNTSACAWANVTSSYEPALRELVSVCQAAVASGRITRVWVGLLTIGPTPNGGEPAMEWTACGMDYAVLQSAAAEAIVHALVNANIPDSLWSWFIPQEPDLTAMPTSNGDCTGDGETTYVAAVAQNLVFTSVRDVLVAPYRLNTTRPAVVAQSYSAFAQCVPELTHVAIQDGVGSYGLDPERGGEYYRAFAAANNALPPNAQGNAIALWATIELFEPMGQICKAADPIRVAKQVAAAQPSVTGMLGFWVYDLPGAPACPFDMA